MRNHFKNKTSGFTYVELLIMLIIVVVLLTVSFSAIKTYRERQALVKDTELVVETLREARNLTIVSKNGTSYGVHLATSSIVLFNGSSYDPSTTSNKVYELSRGILLSYELSNGSDITFARITGQANQTGTSTIYLASTAYLSTTTVRIYQTGTVERSQ